MDKYNDYTYEELKELERLYKNELENIKTACYEKRDVYTNREVCAISGLSRQQLHYYIKIGRILQTYDISPNGHKINFRYNRAQVDTLVEELNNKYIKKIRKEAI